MLTKASAITDEVRTGPRAEVGERAGSAGGLVRTAPRELDSPHCNSWEATMRLLTARAVTFCALIVLAALQSAELRAQGGVQPIQTAVWGGHTYHLLPMASWTASESMAVSLGGHLATIESEPENAFVFSTFTANGSIDRGLWIGLTDIVVEGSFQWVDGSPVGFTRWAIGEPNNGLGQWEEDGAHILWPSDYRAPSWNDAPDVCSC